jgi:methionine-rich copper-binding protein CopC
VELGAVFPTGMRVLTVEEEVAEAMVVDTKPAVVAVTAESPELVTLSREESAREVMAAVTLTEVRSLVAVEALSPDTTLPPVVEEEAPVDQLSATHSLEANAREAMDADSPTVTRRVVEEAEADTIPATTQLPVPRPALVTHSREESAREVNHAVITTVRRELENPLATVEEVEVVRDPVAYASPSKR